MKYSADIQVPLFFEGMKYGSITTLLVKVGDRVDVGDALYELETEQDTYIVESYDAGVVTEVLYRDGSHPVGHVVGRIGYTEDERIEHYFVGIALNKKQRDIAEVRSGDKSIQSWLSSEFRLFVKTNLLKEGSDENLS